MRITFRRTILTGALVLLGSSAVPSGALAASVSGIGLTTAPVSQDLVVPPGTSATTTLQVQNNGAQAENISVQLEQFTADGDSGQAQIVEPTPGDPSPGWVQFSPSSFTAQPGVWNKVTMTINLPKDASLGYYYAVLFVPTNTVNAGGSNLTKFKGANAIFILVDTKSANEKRQLTLESLTADKTVTDFLPVTFSVKVKNTGNIFVVPRGIVNISRSANDTVIDSLDINSAAGNVLPGTTRTFTVAWKDGFPFYQPKRINGQIVTDSQGKPELELTWNFNQATKLRYGDYYARLALVYSNGIRDIETTSALSFWVIPWLLIGGGLVVLLLMAAGLWSMFRKAFGAIRGIRRR